MTRETKTEYAHFRYRTVAGARKAREQLSDELNQFTTAEERLAFLREKIKVVRLAHAEQRDAECL